MERKIRKNSGITLITLIVTIVVMLILVAVSVRVVKNSDLIGVAKQAGKLTEEAKEKEKSGKVTIEGVEYDSIEDYVYGEGPKVTATTYGKAITISLTDSYENYISQKSIAEKEQALAEDKGYENIEALIEGWNYENREAYESSGIIYYGVKTYEEALNKDLMANDIFKDEYSAKYSGDVTVNVWDVAYEAVSKLSTEEKEQALAEMFGYEDIEAFIENYNGGDRKEYEESIISYCGVKTYEEALNIWYMKDVLQSKDSYVLSYTDEEKQEFTIALPYGTYKFTATNEETGRTKKITVTTTKEMGTLTLVAGEDMTLGDHDYNEGDTLAEIEFEKGLSWVEFAWTLDKERDEEVSQTIYKINNEWIVDAEPYYYPLFEYSDGSFYEKLELKNGTLYLTNTIFQLVIHEVVLPS